MQTAVPVLQVVMDRRIAFRLAIVVAGILLANDRRTASAWFAAAGVQDDWDRVFSDGARCDKRVREKSASEDSKSGDKSPHSINPNVLTLFRGQGCFIATQSFGVTSFHVSPASGDIIRARRCPK